jgi:hypothetical protein
VRQGRHLTDQEVRAVDREYTVAWSAGVPKLTLSVTAFRGQKQEVKFGKAYAFTETLRPGEVYNYRFNTKEIKQPIQDAVTRCGWTYRGVAFGKLWTPGRAWAWPAGAAGRALSAIGLCYV